MKSKPLRNDTEEKANQINDLSKEKIDVSHNIYIKFIFIKFISQLNLIKFDKYQNMFFNSHRPIIT